MGAGIGTEVDEIEGLLEDRIVPSSNADDPLAYRREQAALEMEVNANAMTKSLGNFLITGRGGTPKSYTVEVQHLYRLE